MLISKQKGDTLELAFKGHLFVKHSSEKPFISVGRGKAVYEMYKANFTIEEELFEKIALKDFEVIEDTGEKIRIKFSQDKLSSLTVCFQIVKDRLEVSFTDYSQELNRVWIRLQANAEEGIFGCGEQFSELNLRGKNVPLWVSEQGVGRNKKEYTTFLADKYHQAGGDWYTTYYPQPTFVSSENYWCHVDDSNYMEFNFSHDTYHELYIRSIPTKIVLSKLNSQLEVLENLTDYLGRQPEMPDWVYNGVWLGVQGGTEIVLNKLENAQKHGLKVTALWCQDWEGKRVVEFGQRLFWNWKYHDGMYPNLPDTIKELNQRGIRFLGYINQFLSTDGELYQEATKKGYIVKNQQGEDYIVYPDMKGTLLDVSNPHAIEWIKNVIKEHMIGIGLSGWMCDFGEYLPTDAVLYSGESAESFHNKYPAEWIRANREAVEEAGKADEVTFFTRAGYTGNAKNSYMMWAGDQMVDWSLDDGLPSVIPAALSLSMTGFGISHSDIGGYTSLFDVVRTKELFMRWAEMAAFSPVMRTHEGNRPKDCWQFDSDEETLLHFVKMVNVYTHLKPYLQDIVRINSQTGIPCMRMPYIHYEDDKTLLNLKYQYLLGPDLMVAPVYEPGKMTHKVYLPQDTWIHLWTGKEYNQGTFEVNAPLGQIPVFYKKSSKYEELFKTIKNI